MLNNKEVDILGRWEAGPGLETPQQAMKSLLRHGVMQDFYVPDAVMFQDEDDLVIYDPNKEKAVTSISLKDIRNPTAFVKNGESSGMTKVLMLTVAESGHFNFNNIFIAFQCLNDDPYHLVEDFIQLCGLERQRKISDNSVATIPTYASVGRRYPSSSVSNHNSDTDTLRRTGPIHVTSPIVQSALARTSSFLDKPSSIYDHSDDQVQKDKILLNYCTDDIEKLCRELKDSRNNMEGSRRSDSFRATELTSAFQKTKMAFNLLSRLSKELYEPNASDILHHLFPPLAYLMDTGVDLFDEELQKDVVAPLLRLKTIIFLENCLTSNEMHIWTACGPNWTSPRSDFAGEPVPYRPLFSDGWSPGYIDFPEEDEPRPTSRGESYRTPPGRNNSFRSPNRQPQRNGSIATESDYGSDNSLARIPDFSAEDREIFRDKLLERDADIALVIHPWNSHNSKELTVEKGEYLEILNNDKKWWRCRNSDNKLGYVPYTLLTTLVHGEKVWEKQQKEKEARENELQEKAERDAREMLQREKEKAERKARARIPARSPSSSPERYDRRRSPSKRVARSPSPAPSLPPPPPPQPPIRRQPSKKKEEPAQRKPRSNSIQSTYSMADELKNVLTYFSEEKRNLDIHKTPDVFIDMRSTAREVRQWLKDKEFSERALTKLDGMNGKQILATKRKDLEKLFGKEEGGRLDSQITLCRNNTRFTMGKNSELRSALEKAKKRAEHAKAADLDDKIDQYFDDDIYSDEDDA